MGAPVVCFYCLREVSMCSACHLPTLTLQPSHSAGISAWLLGAQAAPATGTAPIKGTQKGTASSQWDDASMLGPLDRGGHPGCHPRARGGQRLSPLLHCCNFPVGLKPLGKEGAVLPWSGGRRCKLASGAQLSCSTYNGQSFKAFLKSSPWGSLNVSVVHLCLHIQTS